ncbi:MAG: hypothetical protein ACRBCS_03005 [Cellvibrionaceae bacterium]
MQLALNFDASPFDSYDTCREFIGSRVHQLGVRQKSIAADMDYSPSDLTRKLAQSPNDSRRFTLDDLEKYVAVTSDKQPIYYLVKKYLTEVDAEELKKQIAHLQSQLEVKR